MAPRYYSMRQVCAMFAVCKSTIHNWVKDREFPAGTTFSPRCRRWNEEELNAYKNSLENRTESAAGRKAMEDRTRAGRLGAASTGQRAKHFWDDVFERLFTPSGLSLKEFATAHCEESNGKPIERKYENGSVRAFSYITIHGEMKKRLRE